MLENLEALLINNGVNESFAQFFKVGISLAVIAILAFIADYVTRRIFLVTVARMAKKTETDWDDILLERNFFHKLAHFAPAIVVYLTIGIALYDYSPKLTIFFYDLTKIYMVIAALLVVNSFLNAVHDIYQSLPFAKSRPIKGYLQVIKIIIYFFGGIVIISILINKNPANLLVGLGASAAILLLVFKDTILGLVASIQLSANNLVKPGDWIEMPSRKIDGTVLEISLNTVKVQNYDRTINTIPTYALISESFQNWQGMVESDGRLIKRSILIDMKSIKFCTNEQLEKFSKIKYLKDYIDSKNKNNEYTSTFNDGQSITNFGVFRKYVEFFLKHNPNINQGSTVIARHRQPSENGMPLEIYCFSKEKALASYEEVQSEIFEHILSIIPEFELRVFQSPTGDDVKGI
ncbi:MAG: mechanosensitive ion channel family protein [Bacteroidales bacterium]|nr:MAG: mechanosensitive ion channel family protein [Bacteroidales bacterium]